MKNTILTAALLVLSTASITVLVIDRLADEQVVEQQILFDEPVDFGPDIGTKRYTSELYLELFREIHTNVVLFMDEAGRAKCSDLQKLVDKGDVVYEHAISIGEDADYVKEQQANAKLLLDEGYCYN